MFESEWEWELGPQIECKCVVQNANAKMQINVGSHTASISRYAQMTSINCTRFIPWNLSEGEVAKVEILNREPTERVCILENKNKWYLDLQPHW